MSKNIIRRLFSRTVYVLVANDCEKVKECIVVRKQKNADRLYAQLRDIYGGANVCMASRRINRIPFLLTERGYGYE